MQLTEQRLESHLLLHQHFSLVLTTTGLCPPKNMYMKECGLCTPFGNSLASLIKSLPYYGFGAFPLGSNTAALAFGVKLSPPSFDPVSEARSEGTCRQIFSTIIWGEGLVGWEFGSRRFTWKGNLIPLCGVGKEKEKKFGSVCVERWIYQNLPPLKQNENQNATILWNLPLPEFCDTAL